MNLIKSFLLLTLVTGIYSCSNTPAVQDFSSTASPSDEFAKFETDLNAASTQQVNVLSPKNFSKAEDSLKDARKSLENPKNSEKTLDKIAKGRAFLNQANQAAQVSRANLEQVLAARQKAIDANAPRIMSSEFEKADDKLKGVTEDIEKNKMKSSMKMNSALQMDYLNIELESIKRANLDKPRSIVKQAIKDDAKKFAPRSLAIAEKSIQEFDAYITANRHETATIAQKNAETLATANHLVKINNAAKSGDKLSSEDLALKTESVVSEKQRLINEKAAQLANKQNELVEGEAVTAALLAKNSNLESELESEQAFNKRFEEARALFTKEEAEVYKQGNTLMIRLKGLEFPVAQAVLKGSNFALLAKVQKVIKDFNGGKVVVEGHTDSTGGKAANAKLSEERAKAVKDYLEANSGDESIDISSLGYDYQKPLATNKTAQGRAQNRRVDILINAENN